MTQAMATEDVFGIVGTTQAGNFHVEKAVAEGGYGVVYRAQHSGFRAPVALKCLKVPEDLTKQQRAVFLEKFREEAELLFRLSASIPEVVRPLHVDVLQLPDGRFVPFLAMEWLEGESLDAIITKRVEQKQAPLGLHKLLKMLRPVAHALSRAHRFPGPRGTESIVHRDLKPENIFLATIGGTESVKILDFGIAKARRLASEAAGRLTGQFVEEDEASSFTPAYGAPEQWAPKRFGATGPWTDVWGFALTMVEVLAGGPAIDGDTYAMRRLALDEKRRPTPRALGATVADEVENVFNQALAVDPRKRTRDLETFWTDLERALGVAPSFGARDYRREDEGAAAPEVSPAAAAFSAAVKASSPVPQPQPAPPAGKGGMAARIARIDLTQVESSPAPVIRAAGGIAGPASSAGGPSSADFSDVIVPSTPEPPQVGGPRAVITRPSAAAARGAAGPASTDFSDVLVASTDFSDVFAPSERAPQPRGYAPAQPQGYAPAPPQGYAAPVEASADPLEFDFDAPRSIGRSPPSSRADLEMSLPTDLGDYAEPRSSARGGGVAAGRAPRLPAYDEGLEASLDSDARSGRRAPRGPDLDIPLDVSPPSTAPRRTSRFDGKPLPEMAPMAPRRSHASDLSTGNLPVEPASEGNAELQQLGARIRGPLAVLLLALAISISEIVYARVTSKPLMLGPIRPFWIAAPLALVGVAFTLWRFMGDRDDG
jgi:eukaryotic-like serine/threonine-protein kinase